MVMCFQEDVEIIAYLSRDVEGSFSCKTKVSLVIPDDDSEISGAWTRVMVPTAHEPFAISPIPLRILSLTSCTRRGSHVRMYSSMDANFNGICWTLLLFAPVAGSTVDC